MNSTRRTRLHGIPTLVGSLAIAAVAAMAAGSAFARAGGGGNYGGGGGGGGFGGGFGGGGGGGGGDGGGELLWLLVRLCIEAPLIGIPLTVAIVAFLLYSAKHKAERVRDNSVIRRGGAAMSAREGARAESAIRREDPEFDPSEFNRRVEAGFRKLQEAWCAQDLSTVRAFVGDGIHERFSLQIREQIDLGYRVRMRNLRVIEVRASNAVVDDRFDALSVAIRASGDFRRVAREPGHPFPAKPPETGPFVEIWTFLRRHGARTRRGRRGLLEGACPNCGDSIAMNQSAKCASCGSTLRSGEHDWVLSEITQSSEWRAELPSAIAGLAALRERDPDLAVQHLEDRASVIFWRMAMADRLGDSKPIRKCASPAFCESLDAETAPRNGVRRYVGERGVGSVETLAFVAAGRPAGGTPTEFDRALVEVRWAGRLFETKGDRRKPLDGQARLYRTLFVLGRLPGVRSRAEAALNSAQCPSCGAPETDAASHACEYCGATLDDGSADWILLSAPEMRSAAALEALRDARTGAGSPDARDSAPDAASAEGSVPPDAALLAWMLRVALTDRVFDDKERKIATRTAARHGVRRDTLEAMIDAARAGALDAPEPENAEQAMRWLAAMADAALADGEADRAERTLMKQVAASMEWGDYDIDLLLKQRRGHLLREAREELLRAKRN